MKKTPTAAEDQSETLDTTGGKTMATSKYLPAGIHLDPLPGGLSALHLDQHRVTLADVLQLDTLPADYPASKMLALGRVRTRLTVNMSDNGEPCEALFEFLALAEGVLSLVQVTGFYTLPQLRSLDAARLLPLILLPSHE